MKKKEAQERIEKLQKSVIDLNGAGTMAKPKLAFSVLLQIVFLLTAIVESMPDAEETEAESGHD